MIYKLLWSEAVYFYTELFWIFQSHCVNTFTGGTLLQEQGLGLIHPLLLNTLITASWMWQEAIKTPGDSKKYKVENKKQKI